MVHNRGLQSKSLSIHNTSCTNYCTLSKSTSTRNPNTFFSSETQNWYVQINKSGKIRNNFILFGEGELNPRAQIYSERKNLFNVWKKNKHVVKSKENAFNGFAHGKDHINYARKETSATYRNNYSNPKPNNYMTQNRIFHVSQVQIQKLLLSTPLI